MKNLIPAFAIFLFASCNSYHLEDVRQVVHLEKGWLFQHIDAATAKDLEELQIVWDTVTVPHDWAISGPFDRENDIIETVVWQDGEQRPSIRTGRTGGLPHVGVAWYQKSLDLPGSLDNRCIHVEFDGVMSNAKVFMNGTYVGEWPYGYASFGFDITKYINFGEENTLSVRVENKTRQSRWYPGAGIYRNVRLVITDPIHVKQWGTYVTTPDIEDGRGTVNIETTLLNNTGKDQSITLITKILSSDNIVVCEASTSAEVSDTTKVTQVLEVPSPELWSVEKPGLYTAKTYILQDGNVLDNYSTPFGFRYLKFTSHDGFYLNGERVQLKGVCLHHDLGPLGAAVNTAALEHRMRLLQEMGCNAIRTSHNPPTPEMLDLADEMGFLVIDEIFDTWKIPKTPNDYGTLWDDWVDKDMIAWLHRDRNHPSIIAWSIGNEINEQRKKDGAEYATFLSNICKREDPTRPTTAGYNVWQEAIENGLADAVDVPGWNYKPHLYEEIHKNHPEWKMYASETASTVSSRGEYFFPAEEKVHYTREPYHSSSFDNEFPRWATSPDKEFAAQEDNPFMAGEFVWTGFDYLGEPTPYNVEWPSRSSYFGIIDLSGIPKDRYYLYQSHWTDKEVLHLLPHWNWEDGQEVSVHAYTSFNRAELFLNGRSLGVKQKEPDQMYTRYRLVWDNIKYEPGEIKVLALDENNNVLKEAVKRTAGKPFSIVLEADRAEIAADGKDLVYITASVFDENGVLCPRATNLIHFSVDGAGAFRAVGNGDPTSLESFVKPYRKAFNGKCMLIVQSSDVVGEMLIRAESDGLQAQQLKIKVL